MRISYQGGKPQWLCQAAIAAFLLCGSGISHSATINSNQNGAWTAGTTWVGGQAPSAVDGDFTIVSGHTVTSPASTSTFDTGIDTLTVLTGGTLSFPTTSTGNQVFTFGDGLTVAGGTLNHGSAANPNAARPLTIAGSGLAIGAAGATINIIGNNSNTSSSVRTLTISAPISGSGNITRYTSGTNSSGSHLLHEFVLSGNNSTYAGNIVSEGGTLRVTNANGLGTTDGTTTIRRNAGSSQVARLEVSAGFTMSEDIIMDSGNASTSLRPIAGTGSLTWNGQITATTVVNPNGTGSLRLESTGSNPLIINGDVIGTTHNGAITFRDVSGGSSLNQMNGDINKPTDNIVDRVNRNSSSDTWTFSGTASTVGTFSSQGGLTLLGAHNALGNSGNGPVLLMGQADEVGKINLMGFNQKIAGLGLDRDDIFVGTAINAQANSNAHLNEITNTSNTASTLTILPNTVTVAEYVAYAPQQRFPGKITGNIHFEVSLASGQQLTMEGDDGAGPNLYAGSQNTYSGTTKVNSGTFLVDGTHTGGGDYTVFGAATLGGSGSITSNVIVAPGGFLAPGSNSIESFSVGSLDLAGTMLVEMNEANSLVNDTLHVVGNLDLTDSLINFSVTGGLTLPSYTLVTYGGPRTGKFTGTVPAGYVLDYTTVGEINLVVPEPSTVCLSAIAGVALLALRRRRC